MSTLALKKEVIAPSVHIFEITSVANQTPWCSTTMCHQGRRHKISNC